MRELNNQLLHVTALFGGYAIDLVTGSPKKPKSKSVQLKTLSIHRLTVFTTLQ
jgi:hypothetical protein